MSLNIYFRSICSGPYFLRGVRERASLADPQVAEIGIEPRRARAVSHVLFLQFLAHSKSLSPHPARQPQIVRYSEAG